MIRVENIQKYFPIKDGFFNKKNGDVKAVENVSFEIPEGEILAKKLCKKNIVKRYSKNFKSYRGQSCNRKKFF